MDVEGLSVEDAWDVAQMLVSLRRAVPMERWVDSMLEAAEESKWAALI